MVTVKIECGCGQHYAFDVEPVNGRIGAAVACPICGADGTNVANQIIASKLPPAFSPPPSLAPTIAPPGSGAHLRLDDMEHQPLAPPAGVKVNARALGLVDRETAETEARAKISWGDSQDDVIRYLMLQGFSAPEAQELVQEMYKERLAVLRGKGVGKIVKGSGLICVPVIAWAFFAHIGVIPVKLMALAVMVGLWGCWLVLTGSLMLIAPKMESGDLAE